jgi:hypothetical protein
MNKEVQDSLPNDVTRGILRAIAVCKLNSAIPSVGDPSVGEENRFFS